MRAKKVTYNSNRLAPGKCNIILGHSFRNPVEVTISGTVNGRATTRKYEIPGKTLKRVQIFDKSHVRITSDRSDFFMDNVRDKENIILLWYKDTD